MSSIIIDFLYLRNYENCLGSMKIAYLTWLEDLESPIIRGQVIDLLESVSRKLQPTDDVYLITFQLFFFKPYSKVTQRLKHFRDKKIQLSKEGIRLIVVPVMGLPKHLPSELFSAKWYILPLISIQVFFTLTILHLLFKIDLVHCRSYPPTTGAILFRILFRRLKLVFDPRSSYPEENVTAGLWGNNSLSFRIWKFMERLFLNESDTTICISRSLLGYYQNISERGDFVQIPNNVNVRRFRRDNLFRTELRSRNNIDLNEILFCYSGSMGSSYWHTPALYANYIIRFRELIFKHRFLFIIPSFEALERTFQLYGIEKDEYIVLRSDFNKVHQYLSCADIGMILMNKKDTRMSIKTAEYLSLGLPVMTNSNVLGAKEIVEENGAGIVMELNSDIETLSEFCDNLLANKKQITNKNRDLARRLFSNDVVSRQYVDVYNNLFHQRTGATCD
jgi:glycosyltransferase involved in cell wall biosynthesis